MKMIMKLVVLLAGVLGFVCAGQGAEVKLSSEDLRVALEKLEKLGVISAADSMYFMKNATGNVANCDGEKVGAMLIAAGKRYDAKVKTVDEALAILHKNKVITNTRTWEDNARKGKLCIGKYTGYLISRLSKELK